MHREELFRNLAETLRDGITVVRPESDNLEDEHIQRAAQKLGFWLSRQYGYLGSRHIHRDNFNVNTESPVPIKAQTGRMKILRKPVVRSRDGVGPPAIGFLSWVYCQRLSIRWFDFLGPRRERHTNDPTRLALLALYWLSWSAVRLRIHVQDRKEYWIGRANRASITGFHQKENRR